MNNYGTGISLKAKFIKCRDEFLGCGSIEADQTSSKQYEVNIRHSLSDQIPHSVVLVDKKKYILLIVLDDIYTLQAPSVLYLCLSLTLKMRFVKLQHK